MNRRKPSLLATGGFTLIELLVVVVILGILATIGTNLIGARERAYLAVMKADLRNMAMDQLPYAIDNYTYAGSLNDLPFTASEGITFELLGEFQGFSARTTHAGLVGTRCAIFMGTVSSVYAPATIEGRIECDGAGAQTGGCGEGSEKSKGKAKGGPC